MGALVPVAGGVLVATHSFCTTTTTVVLGSDGGCLIVDPAVTADEIDVVAAEIATMGRRVTVGFSTHPHWDHMLWRDSLGDAPRYATALGARTAVEHQAGNVMHAQNSVPGVDVSAMARVTALEEGATTIAWAGPKVEVIEHRAHAPGHAALLVSDANVLIAGDMLSDTEIPLPDRMGERPLDDYDAALDVFAELLDSGRADLVIPGHGAVGDQVELGRRIAADRRYIAAVREGQPVEDQRLVGAEGWLLQEHAANVALAAEG
ncbi:MBL fold metallo-hydrolase [Phytoactinopolyspora alkaliphila]|uniref:MBL fold metallo-hydrolase n=1 Tax=Phytoactinopolyspora alkaliphila TaxID=1783498 RepID=A0A6N9YP24_9ACTN|nr:MBL fold metallo-hydrolase [Phytoactinopolyspora alkaliphila]NED96695.1 MBL fold metallo-hydrolase [Phytoactinopolyspora alkaliphila]